MSIIIELESYLPAIRLEYNEEQSFFHFEDIFIKDCRAFGWRWLGITNLADALKFKEYIFKRYNKPKFKDIMREFSENFTYVDGFFILEKPL